jgi:predicted nucleic acid-binding protein
MRKVFADTGYWIALLNPNDTLHQKARDTTTSLKGVPIVTSEMVFTELLNAFSGTGSFYRQKAVKSIEHSFDNPEIEVVIQTN